MPNPHRLSAALAGCSLILLAGCAAPDRLAAPESALGAEASPAMASTVATVPGTAIGAREIQTTVGRHKGGVSLAYDTNATSIINFYSFRAHRVGRDAAKGTFEFTAYYDNVAVVLSGVIVCYTVDGNTARVGGIVTESNFAGIPVGTAETWSITDGTIDTSSTFLGGNEAYAYAYCANGLPYPEYQLTNGDVTIRY